ncbi:hypothetical protein RGV33_13355 [Pseudomonas sp. Bout1]|uniref:hypothetical protein n=1 Tax=Pseudomonas sp. Bout1 TaxID=3048600 RepID=UPI002AB53050|nr:hypothetical protein [Pseudomonas sp. Bout1]MDY7532650.1 hypothetical protein [Pseudomonas sp. Bout1]MEB0189298.1 hypothetical protein [Pseudomonas sp. Bout1]
MWRARKAMPILVYFVSHHFYKHKAEKAYRLDRAVGQAATRPQITAIRPIKYGIYQGLTHKKKHLVYFRIFAIKTHQINFIVAFMYHVNAILRQNRLTMPIQ